MYLKTDNLHTLSAQGSVGEIFFEDAQISKKFFRAWEHQLLAPNFVILSRMETWGYQHHISEYSSYVLAPYIH